MITGHNRPQTASTAAPGATPMVFVIVGFFILIFFGEHILKQQGYAQLGLLIPEAGAGFLFVVAIIQLLSRRQVSVPIKYVIWLATFTALIMVSAVANDQNTGALVAGIRENFKFAPLFLLPLVYRFSERELKLLMYWLMIFSCFQLPMMIYQRLTSSVATGDTIVGTLIWSNDVSVYLISAWTLLFGLYLRKSVKLPLFIIFSLLLLAPTAINETKGSLAILPFAFVVPLLFSPETKHLLVKLILAAAVFAVLAVIYSAATVILLDDRFGYTFIEFYTNPEILRGYFLPYTMGGSWIGRGDALLAAWNHISESWLTLMIGVGLGNTNETSVEVLVGALPLAVSWVQTGLTYYLWELGLVGVLLYLIFPVLSFYDAKKIYRTDTIWGRLATGWTGIAVITLLTSFYVAANNAQSIGFTFCFFAGLIASEASRFSSANLEEHRSMNLNQLRPLSLARSQS